MLLIKDGISANKFRKSQMDKFADLNNLLNWRTFRKCDTLQTYELRTPIFFVIFGFVIGGYAICESKHFWQT
jgi:hypothetical protein